MTPQEHLKGFIKILIKQGKELEALEYLITETSHDMEQAQIYIINIKQEIENE